MDLLFIIYSILYLKVRVVGGGMKILRSTCNFVSMHFQVLFFWIKDCFVNKFGCMLKKVWMDWMFWSWPGVLGCLPPKLVILFRCLPHQSLLASERLFVVECERFGWRRERELRLG